MTDWTAILRRHGIEFLEHGPSTSKGNVYVRCPYCQGAGGADAFFLGISIRTPWRGYGCWRNPKHRGKSPSRLLGALLGISQGQAGAILGERSAGFLEGDVGLLDKLRGMVSGAEQAEAGKKPLQLLPEMRQLDPTGRGQSAPFIKYLEQRGYSRPDIRVISSAYDFHFCMRGQFAYRLIVPIYTDQGLTTWTGRSIVDDETLRYRTLSADPEKAEASGLPVALEPITNCLLNERILGQERGELLVICEGPFDAIRVGLVAQDYQGVHATCIFGKAVYDAQIDKLMFLRNFYRRCVLLLDNDAQMDSFNIIERLAPLGFKTARIDGPWKDPGAMPLDRIGKFLYTESRLT